MSWFRDFDPASTIFDPKNSLYDPQNDLYEILEADPSCSDAELRKKFLQKSRSYHPDKNTSAEATARMQYLNNVWEMLQHYRQVYNANRTAHLERPKPARARPSRHASMNADGTKVDIKEVFRQKGEESRRKSEAWERELEQWEQEQVEQHSQGIQQMYNQYEKQRQARQFEREVREQVRRAREQERQAREQARKARRASDFTTPSSSNSNSNSDVRRYRRSKSMRCPPTYTAAATPHKDATHSSSSSPSSSSTMHSTTWHVPSTTHVFFSEPFQWPEKAKTKTTTNENHPTGTTAKTTTTTTTTTKRKPSTRPSVFFKEPFEWPEATKNWCTATPNGKPTAASRQSFKV